MQKIFKGLLLVMLVACTATEAKKHSSSQEFYFVRHGQTAHNVSKNKKVYGDISLDAVGFEQVQTLKPFIEMLPIKSISCSPLLRARQTMEAINETLRLPFIIIEDLSEGAHENWCELQAIKNTKSKPISKSLRAFLARLKTGLRKALQQKSPTLIVAHGGVYSGLCRILDISTDAWAIANCSVVRFYKKPKGSWRMQPLFNLTGGAIYDQPDSLSSCKVLSK